MLDLIGVGHFSGHAFHNNCFLRQFIANHAMGVRSQISRLAGLASGAETKHGVDPNAPDGHGVRCPIGASRDQPVVVRLRETPLGPFPWQETLVIAGHSIAGHVRTGRFRITSPLTGFRFRCHTSPSRNEWWAKLVRLSMRGNMEAKSKKPGWLARLFYL